MRRSDSAIQDDLQAKRSEIDVPRYDQWIQESRATFRGYVEHVRVQEFEGRDAHLFIASIAPSSHDSEPVFASQFLPGQRLDDIQELLSDQAFKFAKRFLLKNRAYLDPFPPFTFFEKQLSNFSEQRIRCTLDLLLEFLISLEIG